MAQHPSFTRYFIGISLAEPENAFFSEIRRLYHPNHSLTSPPHVTLKPPFLMPNRHYLLEKLAKVARYLEPFTLDFELIGSFRQPKYGTVFLEPRSSEKLKVIERSLSENIAFLPSSKTFYPHLTLAQRVPHEKLKQTKQELRALKPEIKLLVDHIALFRQEESGEWVIDQVFPFGADNSHKHQRESNDDAPLENQPSAPDIH
jgi:2'-5' RNA ligase